MFSSIKEKFISDTPKYDVLEGAVDDIEEKHQVEFLGRNEVSEIDLQQEDDFVYESNILRDLEDISKSLSVRMTDGRVHSDNKNEDEKVLISFKNSDTIKRVDGKPESLKHIRSSKKESEQVTHDIDRRSQLDPYSLTRYIEIHHEVWSISKEDYRNHFVDKCENFRREELRELIHSIAEHYEDKQFWYILNKYETSILTVKNTLENALEAVGYVSQKLIDLTKDILGRLSQEILNKENLINDLKRKEEEAVLAGLENTLEEEIDFIERYVDNKSDTFGLIMDRKHNKM